MAKLFDFSPLEELEILETGNYEKDGVTYTTQNLSEDLVMVWADIDGVRQRNSIAIQPSKINDRITQYKLKAEALDKQVQIRMSNRLFEDLQELAAASQLGGVAEYIRIICQKEVDKQKDLS